jgi:hypothetical protein
LYATIIPEMPGQYFVDVVTAKHVIQHIRHRSVDGRVWLRFNAKDGGTKLIETTMTDWEFHPDSMVDVAICWAGSTSEFDALLISEDDIATQDVIKREGIGIGDEVFITGLFVNHYGSERNIPILRAGNIAAVPSEPVQTGMGPMDAYLVEARSIGGLSGSPVFVYLDPLRQWSPKGTLLVSTGESGGGKFHLLGLIHGHYDVSANMAGSDGLKEEAINMGIAIVVPVSKVVEAVALPARLALRAQKVAEFLKAQSEQA